MKRIIVIVILMFAVSSLTAIEPFQSAEIKDRDVEKLDLSEAGKDKLKLGISIGYPLSGVTAGWQVGKSLEIDALVGSMDYENICLGGSAMISLVDIEIADEEFPLTAGPFVYTALGQDYFGLSAGAMARIEYTFDIKLNLYFETGLMVNFLDQANDTTFNIPASLGVRYVF